MSKKKYLWDVAISLCKEDVDFATKLVKVLNPSLKVFFYADRQQELISQSGPVAFAKTFKEDSRVIVILSRKEWSTSFYTEIEQNAILDRTKTEGYQFLMVIPMVSGEIPVWYPETRIYGSAPRYSVEELAQFIEFKVTEVGGEVKPITVEERHRIFLDRMEQKKKIVNLQETKEGIESARSELNLFKECFNKKIKFLQNDAYDSVAVGSFMSHIDKAHFGIGNYLLECEIILPDRMTKKIVTTQDFRIRLELSQIFGNGQSKKSIELEDRLFYYNPPLMGWSLPYIHEQATRKELSVLFRNRDNSERYDLTKPTGSDVIVDEWFHKLLSKVTPEIERYI